MAFSQIRVLLIGSALLLGGCSFTSDSLFPSLGSEDSSAPGDAGSPDAAKGPVLGTTNFEPGPVTPGAPTGTFVGRKVQAFRGDLAALKSIISQRNATLQTLRTQTSRAAASYHELVGAINARLQVGSTPGNPILVANWRRAQELMNAMSADVAKLSQLSTEVSSDSAMAAYLLDSVRASYSLSGAIEEDHRQLRVLEDDTNQTVVLIERLLKELNGDISRQQQYVANERGNLNVLSASVQSGQMYGSGVSAYTSRPTSDADVAPARFGSMDVANRRPLVVIRFDRANVSYEQALYQAVSQALERRPAARFDLVAVSPSAASPGQSALGANSARRNAESVMRSLSGMGLPASRVEMAATTSAQARGNEVHLYLR
ncbi:MAG: hypothetical protein JXQ84_01590 [Rhodospirillaceae bacterium]|nr:hypothetical protein [Rhodospirillaceae bacterium]